MFDHDKDGNPVVWSAEGNLRRTRKALRDAVLAVLVLLVLCCLVVVWSARGDDLPAAAAVGYNAGTRVARIASA